MAPIAAKLLIASKKVMGCKKWDGPPLSPCEVWWGSCGSRAGCRRKSVMFFLSVCFLSRFGMTKFVITETLWSSISFKTIMVSLHTGMFVVVHRCSSFPIDPKIFSRGANFLPKIAIFGDFWSRTATFLKLQRWNLACGCGLGAPSPGKILFKKWLKGIYPFGENLYQKLPFLAIFGGRKPTSTKPKRYNLAGGCEPGRPSPCQILKKKIPPFGKIIPKISNFGYFDACKPTFLKPQPWSLAWGYGPGTPSPCLILKNITQKIAQWACRYCIALGRWCILISSFFLLRFLSHFSLYYLPLFS